MVTERPEAAIKKPVRKLKLNITKWYSDDIFLPAQPIDFGPGQDGRAGELNEKPRRRYNGYKRDGHI